MGDNIVDALLGVAILAFGWSLLGALKSIQKLKDCMKTALKAIQAIEKEVLGE